MKELLDTRTKTHGDFRRQFVCAQDIKAKLRDWGMDYELDAIAREAMEMIALKQSRILTGDPNHADHWRDIAGYATRIADYLEDK